MKLLELKKVSKVYGEKNWKTEALKEISMEIESGEFIAIMGPSGCGKSTLLNIIGTIDLVTDGHYYFKGKEIDKRNINKQSELRNKEIGFVFQNFALIKDFTVYENVELPLKFRGIKKEERKKIAIKYLRELGIEDKKDEEVRFLSGGQQQRVAICRALVQESDLILADEPTGALDQENGKNIMETFSYLNEKYGKTIILVTHDYNIAKYCDKIIKMKDGKIEEVVKTVKV